MADWLCIGRPHSLAALEPLFSSHCFFTSLILRITDVHRLGRLNERCDPVGCQPKSFWMIVRHGTRNPSDDAIREIANDGNKLAQEIVANHKAGRCHLHVFDIELLALGIIQYCII